MSEFLYIFQYYGYYFVILASLFAMFASWRVNHTFSKYSRQISRQGLTGAQAAERVLHSCGAYGVKISKTSGNLTDHYNPKDNTIYLSDAVYDQTSTAAIGVAAHEAGHAVQHAEGYFPIRVRSAIVPITNLGSRLSMPLILLGLLFSYQEIALVGVLCFSVCVIFQLVTLPTEFNASKRAILALEESMILDQEELKGAKKTLTAAAMTYVAALAVSLLQFLRLLAIVSNSRRRR